MSALYHTQLESYRSGQMSIELFLKELKDDDQFNDWYGLVKAIELVTSYLKSTLTTDQIKLKLRWRGAYFRQVQGRETDRMTFMNVSACSNLKGRSLIEAWLGKAKAVIDAS